MASDRHVQASCAGKSTAAVAVAVAQLTSTSSAEENLAACEKLMEVSYHVLYQVLDA